MADTYVVERSTTVEAPPSEVFEHVVDLQKWEAWSPWAKMDPDMRTTYSGDPGTVGSGYHWVGNRKVGEGRMTVTEIEAPERVAIDLKFLKPFKSESVTELMVMPDGDGSRVIWRMTGEHNWLSKIIGLIRPMDKMVGPDFEKGLADLKVAAES